MLWNMDDLELFHKEKDYIDTVILPFVPIEWGSDMGRTVQEGRFSLILGEETEHQLKGRVILSPPFTYLKSQSLDDKIAQFHHWIREIRKDSIKFIVCITSDPSWHSFFQDINESGLVNVWLPAVPFDHLNSTHQQDYLDENVGQIIKKMTHAWMTK